MDDQDLYVKFLDGNQKAFEDIMDRYSEKLIYFIYSYVKDSEAAKDLSQDVFVYVLMNKEKYNFKYPLKTYLFVIARSKAIDYLRKQKRKVEFKEEYLYQDDLIKDVEEIVFDNIRKQEIKKILFDLDETQRKNDIFSRNIRNAI